MNTDIDLLFQAIKNEDISKVGGLITDANVNADSEWEGKPMNAAARTGNIEIVELLLNRGADIESKDGTEMTPLMNAAVEGHVALVMFLLDHGARITNDLLMTISQKVNILEENAELGMVNPEAVKAWQNFLDELMRRAKIQQKN